MSSNIASDKFKLLRKVDFLLKSGFQVIAFFIILEVGYLVAILVNICLQMSTTLKKYLIGLYFRNIFPIGGLVSIWLYFSN